MAGEFKFNAVPVQCRDELDELVERQACRLFEEFLLLPADPVCMSVGFVNSAEVADSPIHGLRNESYKLHAGAEAQESCEDDMVPDSGVIVKGKSSGKAAGDDKSPLPPAASGDQKLIKDLAIKIQTAGDQLMEQYGERASGIESTLLNVISQSATRLTYEAFSKEVDRLIGQDRTWTNMVLAYYVGKRVVTQAKEAKHYFSQYFLRSYTPMFHDAGGVEPYVNSHMPQ